MDTTTQEEDMPGTPAKATAPKARAGESASDNLTAEEQEAIRNSDEGDTATHVKSDMSGKRLRAIPSVITKSTGHATTIEVRRSDFKAHDIDHPTVQFDFRKDNYTLKVGKKAGQISQEAADFLAQNFPQSYEYINE